ncbi:MAG: Tryptophan repressor binding protein [Chlamydiales bacterium]|jgi:multimeric flavodoxin WrbA|nr:Tryptophan repressor binding protein [Chlamydiales bacterium]
MKIKIVIAYHSGYGHTAKVAEILAQSMREADAHVDVLRVDNLSEADWEILDNANAIIFGSPTYMGSVSGPFKMFMDASSKKWSTQKWKDKIAAGFTNSASYSGDKLVALQQLFHFAMQHAMVWIGQSEMPPMLGDHEIVQPDAINRLGSFAGLMTQSNHKSSPELAPSTGDLETAKLFGKRIVNLARKLASFH